MTDDAEFRHRLYRYFEQVLGPDDASALMASLPPMDWSQLATKEDLEVLRLATKADIAELREATQRDFAELREATQRDIAELREATRHEVSAAVLTLQRELAELSGGFERSLRTELSKQSRAAVAGMVGMTATVGAFVLGLLSIAG